MACIRCIRKFYMGIRNTKVISFDCFPFISSFVLLSLFVRFFFFFIFCGPILCTFAICKVSLFLFYFIHYFCTFKIWCWHFVCIWKGRAFVLFTSIKNTIIPWRNFLAKSKKTTTPIGIKREWVNVK